MAGIDASLTSLRERIRALKRETLALYFAVRDPRTPLLAKLVAGVVVAYALSPIDLIPDFIPVLGYLDDLILVPLGIMLAVRLIPAEVLVAARVEAEATLLRPTNRVAAAVIVTIWIACALLLGWWLAKVLRVF